MDNITSEEILALALINSLSSSGAHAQMPTHTQTQRETKHNTAFSIGLTSKSSFPEGLIMLSQYGKSISRPWQNWWPSSPHFPFFCSPSTEMHRANSHCCRQSQFVNIAIFILCDTWAAYSLSPSLILGANKVNGSSSNWHITNCRPFCRCNSLGADDIWDQTVWWDSSQWNSWGPGERGATASATNLYHRCLYDHGEM